MFGKVDREGFCEHFDEFGFVDITSGGEAAVGVAFDNVEGAGVGDKFGKPGGGGDIGEAGGGGGVVFVDGYFGAEEDHFDSFGTINKVVGGEGSVGVSFDDFEVFEGFDGGVLGVGFGDIGEGGGEGGEGQKK